MLRPPVLKPLLLSLLIVCACAGSNDDVPLPDGGVEARDADTATDGGELDAELDLRSQERAQRLVLPDSLPAARGNQYAEREDAALFGFHLFFDKGLGEIGGCPSCHLPELAFTDRRPVSMGKALGTRNSPTVFNAARLSVLFWDGKADSLWSQALFAIESPLEMGSSRLALAHHIARDAALRAEYEGVFGPLPDTSSWPASGKPGDVAFDQLPTATQFEVNRIAANIGKALEAYQRKNSSGPSELDRFLLGTGELLGPAKQGLALFLRAGCDSCHGGPMLTDERFHDVGFPSLAGAASDPGQAEGLSQLRANPFNLAGPYADPGPGVPSALPEGPGQVGAFRTPSLRNVARTAPYGHDGALSTLREVLAVHAPELTEGEGGAMIAFLTSLNGDTPPLPWSKWPTPQ